MAKQEYVQNNRQWLQAKAQEPDVKPLDRGIYYKVIKSGKPDAYRNPPLPTYIYGIRTYSSISPQGLM